VPPESYPTYQVVHVQLGWVCSLGCALLALLRDRPRTWPLVVFGVLISFVHVWRALWR
jgi:hypothetical protein